MNEKQREILVITQEECAEVIQEVSKIFRFGIDNQHKDGMLHQEKLEQGYCLRTQGQYVKECLPTRFGL